VKSHVYKNNKIRKWELALLLALCISLCAGMWAQREQHELAGKMIRLHVIASSNSQEDQALKLEVRNQVISALEPVLEGRDNVIDARATIKQFLPELEAATKQFLESRGRDCDVSVTLGREYYPTRVYEGFSLPAGEYDSLRVILGEGKGENWWCVVFPPLCFSVAQVEAAEISGLDLDDISLITEENEGYILKFKIIELWGILMGKLKGIK